MIRLDKQWPRKREEEDNYKISNEILKSAR